MWLSGFFNPRSFLTGKGWGRAAPDADRVTPPSRTPATPPALATTEETKRPAGQEKLRGGMGFTPVNVSRHGLPGLSHRFHSGTAEHKPNGYSRSSKAPSTKAGRWSCRPSFPTPALVQPRGMPKHTPWDQSTPHSGRCSAYTGGSRDPSVCGFTLLHSRPSSSQSNHADHGSKKRVATG